MDRVLHGRLRALQDSNSSRGAGGPSDYLVHSPKLAFLGQQATLDQYVHHESLRQTFPPQNLGGSQTTEASTQAGITQQSPGSVTESSRKNVIPPRPFC